MPNGVRMSRAFHLEENCTVLAREGHRFSQHYACDSCRVPVSFVRQHEINGQDKELRRTIPPFFRLKSGALHGNNCEFTAAGQIASVVARARAVEDQVNPFDPLDRDRYSFRLNVPMEIYQTRHTSNGEAGPRVPKEEFARRMEAVWSGQRLESYCRSALGLAMIWSAIERAERNSCKSKITIRFQGRDIDWEDFIFPMEHYDSLAYRLEKADELEYPAAVLVEVRTPTEGQRRVGLLPCVTVRNSRIHTRQVRVSPKLSIINADLWEHLIPGNRYLVFGRWRRGKNSISNGIEYREVSVKIFQEAQFCLAPLPDQQEADEATAAMGG